MPAIARAVSDFPDPNSPTIAMVSPRSDHDAQGRRDGYRTV